MRLLQALACFVTALLTLLCLSSPASAQNVSVDFVEREVDALDTFPFAISQEQCVGGDVFTFPAVLSNLGGVRSFQVWISEGVDCSRITARQPASGAIQCQQLGTTNGAPEQFTTVEATAEEIASQGIGARNCVDADGDTAARTVSVYFMLIRTNDADVPAEDFTVFDQITVDLVGPAPPTNIEANASDSAVELTFETSANEADRLGFRFYCDGGGDLAALDDDATTGEGGASDAGVGGSAGIVDRGGATSGGGESGAGGDGGAGGAGGDDVASTSTSASATTGDGVASSTSSGSASSVCGFSTPLVAGALPSPSWKTCGSVQGVGGEGTAKGLKNGRTYAIAIAGIDQLENPGVISEVVCATPFAVTDFYEAYTEAGGQAGGGICAASSPGMPTRAWMAGAAAVGLSVLAWRRRRRGGNA